MPALNDDRPDLTRTAGAVSGTDDYGETIVQSAPPQGSAAGSASAAEPIPGHQVVGEIARGGMGLVLAAHDLTLDREVAVKALRPGFDGTVARTRFVNEAKLTARLQHPAIPPVYELGTGADGAPFLTMKLIKGRTLAAELDPRPGPDALPKFLSIFEQIAHAVGFAHSQGIVHRDLKPANIMVGRFGEVQVMDWGIAKVLTPAGSTLTESEQELDPNTPLPDAPELTVAGSVLGTPAYMAPEQARGERTDARADVFALGGILCDILTGAPPFAGGATADVLRRAASGEIAPARHRLDGCGADPELAALAKRCLDPEPANRPADGTAVAAAVAEFRAHAAARLRKAEAERAEAAVKAAEQRKRRQWQLTAAAAVLVLVAGGAAVAWWADRTVHERRADEERRAAEERAFVARNAKEIEAAVVRCEGALQAGERELAAAELERAGQRLSDGGGEPFADRLARCRTDLALLADLDATDDIEWLVQDGHFLGTDVAVVRWPVAFRAFGLVPGETPPAEAAKLLTQSLVRDRALTGLDRWFQAAPTEARRALLNAADPDAFRDQVRSALLANDAAALVALANREDAMRQPARFIGVLGGVKAVPLARRGQLLRTAFRVRPNDFSLLMTLGLLQPDANQAGGSAETWRGPGYGRSETSQERTAAVEQVGWFRAAAAVRPRSVAAWNNLGVALKMKGDLTEALAAGRRALELDPKYGPAHNNFANSLFAAGDQTAARAAYEKSIELLPDCPLARCNLGALLWQSGDLPAATKAFEGALQVSPNHPTARDNLEKVRKGAKFPPLPPPGDEPLNRLPFKR